MAKLRKSQKQRIWGGQDTTRTLDNGRERSGCPAVGLGCKRAYDREVDMERLSTPVPNGSEEFAQVEYQLKVRGMTSIACVRG